MEQFIHSLADLDPLWVYVAIFLIAYVENIFPPLPSDVVVVFGGSLVAVGKGHFLVVLTAGTLGSTLGFLTMFAVGRWFGKSMIESGKIKFISLDAVHKAEQWFRIYGYGLVIANRFLAGTRAVVSFFAGMSDLDVIKTIVLSFVSSLTWNGILVYAGYVLGHNWKSIGLYLSTYSQVVSAIVVIVVLILILRFFYLRKSKKNG